MLSLRIRVTVQCAESAFASLVGRKRSNWEESKTTSYVKYLYYTLQLLHSPFIFYMFCFLKKDKSITSTLSLSLSLSLLSAVSIESVGMLQPNVLFEEAIKVLMAKCQTILGELDNLTQTEEM